MKRTPYPVPVDEVLHGMAVFDAWCDPARAEKRKRSNSRQGMSSQTMEKRKLGKSNIEVSVVGIGCNNFGRRIHDVAGARGPWSTARSTSA